MYSTTEKNEENNYDDYGKIRGKTVLLKETSYFSSYLLMILKKIFKIKTVNTFVHFQYRPRI
jgi:hypothetical protein